MRRLNLFAKGNVDVRDSLLYSRVGGTIQFNGINEIARQRFPGWLVRVQHEIGIRSDALLSTTGAVPPELPARNLPLGPLSLEAQFSRKLFTASYDAVVLSIQPDVLSDLSRHRRQGYLLQLYDARALLPHDQQWLADNFDSVGLLDASESMENLDRICQEIRSRLDVPILVCNMSAVVPGEQIDCYQGLGEILSTRVRRFNLGLIELSRRSGICIVDVDTIVARAGADRLKVDLLHLTAEGYRLVAEEVARILHDLGCLG